MHPPRPEEEANRRPAGQGVWAGGGREGQGALPSSGKACSLSDPRKRPTAALLTKVCGGKREREFEEAGKGLGRPTVALFATVCAGEGGPEDGFIIKQHLRLTDC